MVDTHPLATTLVSGVVVASSLCKQRVLAGTPLASETRWGSKFGKLLHVSPLKLHASVASAIFLFATLFLSFLSCPPSAIAQAHTDQIYIPSL